MKSRSCTYANWVSKLKLKNSCLHLRSNRPGLIYFRNYVYKLDTQTVEISVITHKTVERRVG